MTFSSRSLKSGGIQVSRTRWEHTLALIRSGMYAKLKRARRAATRKNLKSLIQ
jgi:hypothetical protein